MRNRNFIYRVCSSLVGGGLLIGAIWYGPYTFFIAFLLIILLTQWEFYALFRLREVHRPFRWGGLLLSTLLFGLCFAWQQNWVHIEAFLWLLPLFFLFFLRKLLPLGPLAKMPFVDMAITLMGTVYVGGGFSVTNWLVFRHGFYDYGLLLAVMLMVWAYDSGAYLAGSVIGKHKLLPRISPKKSWEGVAGGMLLAMVVGLIFANYSEILSKWAWLLTAFLVAGVGTVGDLSESLLKRAVGVKDSGRLIPGHGGFLDRFDTLLFVVAFLTPLLLLFRDI